MRERAREILKRVARPLEPVVWGGSVRERVLVALLRLHYQSLLRRQWSDPDRAPHFFDHRIGAFGFATGTSSAFSYYRGYFAAEVIRERDRVLDIGCGDGFFDRRFFAPRAAAVDAIDIEPSAIAHATRYNPAPNIAYSLLDAVTEAFPHPPYDVVVWDGGLGHVTRPDADRILPKIRTALSPNGVFVGSESLGHEGEDHMQFFASQADLRALFESHFTYVHIRSIEYELPTLTRREAFWRCASSPSRMQEAAWSPSSL
jgi:2-polyprenyl-3-methyl-5-hydroxy-6-metoxy-1,4-benzoquinol methylase